MTKTVTLSAKELTTSTRNTAVDPSFDLMFRFWQAEPGSPVSVATSETKVVARELNAWQDRLSRQVESLRSVIQWQHRLLEYQGVYTAYLLNAVTDEQFEEEARAFEYEPEHCDPAMLMSVIEDVVSLAGVQFAPSDFADMLRCQQENVLEAVERLRSKLPQLEAFLPRNAE